MATQQEFFGEQPESVRSVMNVTAAEFFTEGDEPKIHAPVDDEERLNFAQRFGEDIAKRAEVDREIKAAHEAGEIGLAEGLLQTIGKTGFGSVLDFLGEAVVSAGRGLSNITPDVIERPLRNGAAAAAHFLLDTDVGQEALDAATKGVDAWADFKRNNPRAARNTEAVVNIGLLLAPVKAKPKVSPPTPVGRAAQALETRATAQSAAKREDFVIDLISPKQTATVRAEQVARTEEAGLLRSKVIEPSPIERNIASEVSTVEGVSPAKTLQGNYNAISDEVSKEAKRLKSELQQRDVIFPRKEFNKQLEDAGARLADNPLLVGDAQKTAERIVLKMRQIVDGKKSTASNLLEARKELDAWIKSQKGPSIFDPNQENALSIAIREIRTTTNEFIDRKAVSAGVKESLRKQSRLLSAMDDIAPKAADEASNAVLRLWQNAQRILPLRGEFNQSMAIIFGLGGLGAAAVFAPFFTKLTLGAMATYATGKALMSPQVKRGLSALLKQVDNAIRVEKDQQLIQQMRLDRALILELIEISGEKLEEVDEKRNPPEPA